MTPEQIGEYLEHQGATDDEIDEFLEHFGVKGMRWGVRRDNRAQNYKNVGAGKGTFSDKARAYSHLGPIDLAVAKSFKGASARKGDRLLKRNERVRNGEASVMDVIKYYGMTKHQDIIPTKRDRTNPKAALGASIAGVMLVGLGKAYIQNKAVSA